MGGVPVKGILKKGGHGGVSTVSQGPVVGAVPQGVLQGAAPGVSPGEGVAGLLCNVPQHHDLVSTRFIRRYTY